ncbi:hypothetical protein [Actinokineospora cianjurensis]|uniref:Uncharacterized protein n=1 Tax=Actinokineospora cianjurensis TaxID=585224 RepID=A0A421AZR6_9PSEU|nr:hypothetical protein [Actinokineospora cianjurensis]RLK55318.1 hypothetical protein CLV68_4803 [Actinokineospora cianjurensis]
MERSPSTTLDHVLLDLRGGAPVTAAVLDERGGAIRAAAGWNGDRPDVAHLRLNSALDAVEPLAAAALRAAWGVDGADGETTLEDRRLAFARAHPPLAVSDCSHLEEHASAELASRLLGGHYGAAPERLRCAVVPGGLLIGTHKVTTVYLDGRLEGRRHTVEGLVVDSEALFTHRAPQGTRLARVDNAEVAQVRVVDGHTEFVLRPAVTGSAAGHRPLAQFGFVEALPKPTRFRLSRRLRDQFDVQHHSLRVSHRLEFLGEPPRVARVDGTARPLTDREGTTYDWLDSVPVDRACVRAGTTIRTDTVWGAARWPSLLVGLFFVLPLIPDLPLLLGDTGALALDMWAGAQVVSFCLALTGFFTFVRHRHRLRFKSGHGSLNLRQVPLTAVDPLQEGATDTKLCTAVQALIFAQGVVQSRQLRQRLVETYVLDQRTVRQRVSIDVEVPRKLLQPRDNNGREHPQTIYFPVLIPRKSKFQDDFSVHGPDGEALHVLPYRQYLQLAATVLRQLLVRATGVGTPWSLPDAVRAAERDALALIVARRTADGYAPDIALDEDWAARVELPADATQAQHNAKLLATEFVRMLSLNYAIVVPLRIDRNGRALVKFEQTLTPELNLSSRKQRLALLLGARPIDLTFSIVMASTCQSYHLRVAGTDDLYLGDQDLVDSAATLQGQATNEYVPPHVRFRRRLGQPYAHVYTRFFPEPAAITTEHGATRYERPSVRLKFFETPPGSLFRAVVSSLACLALVWIVGVVSSRNPGADTDAPAFLLVFPAVVGAWLGFDAAGRRLLEGTLAARLSLGCTVLISILSTGLFLAHRGLEHVIGWHRLPFSVLWINDWSWLVVVLLAGVNAAVTALLYLRRTAFYSYLATRAQGEGEVLAHG